MRQILPPRPRELLLPIVSCLPTAFLSPKPPPALLPLLSPILRQRLTFLSASIPSPDPNAPPSGRNAQQTWLKLLTWNPARGERLVDIVGDMQLEPHPVSGEPELFDDAADADAAKVHFRRLDQETLQAKCDVPMHKVGVVWVWCVNDSGAVGVDALTATDGEDAWRVAEVRPVGDGVEDPTENQERWYDSMGEAEEAFEQEEQASYDTMDALNTNGTNGTNGQNDNMQVDDDDDDGSYWAAYDRTPGKTPTPNPKSGLGMTAGSKTPQTTNVDRDASVSEADYYAQYASVQPAMDAHDPDEDHSELLNNSVPPQQQSNPSRPPLPSQQSEELLSERTLQVRRRIEAENRVESSASPLQPFAPQPQHAYQKVDDAGREIHSPSPKRPSSSGSNGRSPITEHLEQVATHSESPPPPPATQAEAGVRSHVGYEIKSLFRLCKSMGIDRAEFQRVVKTELDLLPLVDEA